MKVAITGHTNGIGLGLYNYFLANNYELTLSVQQAFDIVDMTLKSPVVIEEVVFRKR